MIRVAVIGVGHLGSSHARIYKRHDRCQLTGVFDTDQTKAGRIANEYGVKAFADLNEALSGCDAVSIATPTTSHFEIGLKAIEAGKHILMEKPITANVAQAVELTGQARVKGIVLQVGHIERFNPAFTSVMEFIRQPLFIETHRLSRFAGRGIEVDVILDLMIHDIDLILKLTGEEPSEIRCAGAPVLTSTSDIANVRLEFRSGCTANITASRISTHPMRKMRIFQKGGYISIDFAERKSEVYLLSDDNAGPLGITPAFVVPAGVEGKSIRVFYPQVKQIDMLEAEIGNFIDSIEKGIAPEVDGPAGLRALKVAAMIIEHLPKLPSAPMK